MFENFIIISIGFSMAIAIGAMFYGTFLPEKKKKKK